MVVIEKGNGLGKNGMHPEKKIKKIYLKYRHTQPPPQKIIGFL